MPVTHNTSSPTVVLIGGGHSHALVLLSLRQQLPDACRIVLINSSPYAVYSGMLPGLITGHYQFNDCQINVAQLCQHTGVEFIDDSVTHIDTQQQLIHTAKSEPLAYDILSINIGSSPAVTSIEDHHYGHSVKPIAPFLQRWQQWLSQLTALKADVVIAGGGAASVELAFAINQKLIQLGKTATVTLICGDALLANHNRRGQQQISNNLAKQNIQLITGQKVISADQHSVTLSSRRILNSDFTVWAINAGSVSWLADSGLACNEQGFIKVDKTLRSTSQANVFAVGDCCHFTPQPLPKAGVFAVKQAPILANNLLAQLEQQPLTTYQPQKRFLSLLAIGKKQAVLSWGPLVIAGSWIWHLKNHIDKKFISLFQQRQS